MRCTVIRDGTGVTFPTRSSSWTSRRRPHRGCSRRSSHTAASTSAEAWWRFSGFWSGFGWTGVPHEVILMLIKAVQTWYRPGYGIAVQDLIQAGSITFLTKHDRELVHGSVHELWFNAVTSSRSSRRLCS
jgi:hypothetical protein